MKTSYFPLVPWILSGIVTLLAFLAWMQGYGWSLSGIGARELFPLFGLLAFSLMWVHYAVDFLERVLHVPPATDYLPTSRYVVLVALLLHPGLLAWTLWQSGSGVPPMSWFAAVNPTLGFWITLGIIAWLGFLIFELYRWYRNHPWWKWVGLITDLAMVAIVYHGLAIGDNTQSGWFHYVWLFYAATLFISIGYYYYQVYWKGKTA